MVEQREHRRLKNKMVISVVYRDEHNQIDVEQDIIGEDISPGGLKITLPHQLPKGKIIELKLFLFSDPIPISTKGKVAWSNEKQKLEVTSPDKNDKLNSRIYWVGIEFIDIEPFTQERIIRWIKKEFDVKRVYLQNSE
ncbi:MAG: PilZ domain-containing protein [Candidatus Omnitrophota bacterium]